MKVSCIAEFDQIYFIYQALRSNPSFVRVLFQMFQDTFKWVVMVRQCLLVYMCLRLLRMCVCTTQLFQHDTQNKWCVALLFIFSLCVCLCVFSKPSESVHTFFSFDCCFCTGFTIYVCHMCATQLSSSLSLSRQTVFGNSEKKALYLLVRK